MQRRAWQLVFCCGNRRTPWLCAARTQRLGLGLTRALAVLPGVEFECFDDVHETNKDKVVGPPPVTAARPTAGHAATAGVRSPNPVAQLTPAQPNYT